MTTNWTIQILDDGTGVIEHRGNPRFHALWKSGLCDLETIEGFFWCAEGHDADDTLTLFAFQWQDSAPGQHEFEALMREAVREIDAWIAARF